MSYAWAAPSLDAEAAAAIAALEAPSRPRPLPESRRVGDNAWQSSLGRDEVIAAYLEPGAPVPPRSQAGIENGVLVIRAPFSTTAILFSNAPTGCRYSLLPGPTLRIEGGGAPEGDYHVACGIDKTSLESGKPQRSLIAVFQSEGQDWLVWVQENEGGSRGIGMGGLAAIDMRRFDDVGDELREKATKATISDTEQGVRATFTRDGAEVQVTAVRTHSLCSLVTTLQGSAPELDPTYRITCVTKLSTGPMDQRIRGIGGTVRDKPWRMDVERLVAEVESGKPYYLLDGDDQRDAVFLTVDTGTTSSKYPLAASGRSNLLFSLPKCRQVTSPLPGPEG